MKLDAKAKAFFQGATKDELEQAMYDIRDFINYRNDTQDVVNMMANNELETTGFCKRKRPS